MSRRSSLRFAVAITLIVAGAAGCITGERPTLSAGPQPTGDVAADAVLERFELVDGAAFTAVYAVATKQQPPAATQASVVQDGSSQRSVTIGDVRFVATSTVSVTCATLAPLDCTPSIDEARVSNFLVTSSFYGASQAARLRNDVSLRVGPTMASTADVAGRAATCVAVPVAATTNTYCAYDDGVLARLDAADVAIEATSYVDTVDPAAFVVPEP